MPILSSTLIAGRLVDVGEESVIREIRSPYSQQVVGVVADTPRERLDEAVKSAGDLLRSSKWAQLSVRERGERLVPAFVALTARCEGLVERQISEVGLIRQFVEPHTARMTSLAYLESEVVLAEEALRDELRMTAAGSVLVSRVPIGVSLHIVPWNGPVPGLIAKLIPALLAGCPVIVKSATLAPLSAGLVAEAFAEVDLPAGLISIVHGDVEVGDYLVRHPGVDHVSFTGSTAVGRHLAAVCGELLKPVTLELGGKSAAIVLDDVDIAEVVPRLVATTVPSSGQVCWSTTRILAPTSRVAELAEALGKAVSDLRMGDPSDAATQVGPLVNVAARERALGFLHDAVEAGATRITGSDDDSVKGSFVRPTVLTGVDNRSDVAQREIFGPVICVIEFEDDEDAVAKANDSDYGLGGAVHSKDVARALNVAKRIETGTCSINGGAPGGGGGPFGGFKQSGLGREKGIEGYHYLTQLQSISLGADDTAIAAGLRHEGAAS